MGVVVNHRTRRAAWLSRLASRQFPRFRKDAMLCNSHLLHTLEV